MRAGAFAAAVPGPATSEVEICVLGVLRAQVASVGVELRPRERALLAALALGAPGGQSIDQLIELLWSRSPPPTARKSLGNHVARVRRVLGSPAVETAANGYRIGRSVATDVDRFVDGLGRLREMADPDDRATLAPQLLALWRGLAYEELPDLAGVLAARRALDEQRMQVEESLAAALLERGNDGEAVLLLARLVEEEPYREQRWHALLVSRYRQGGRRDALLALGEARRALGEVGLGLGPALLELERRILDDDPKLQLRRRPLRPGPTRPLGSLTKEWMADEVFVGRDLELEQLQRQLGLHGSSKGRPVVVFGEAGIGKTTLVRRLAEACRAAGMLVVTVAAGLHPELPMEIWHDVVAQLTGRDVPPRGADAAGHPARHLEVAVRPGGEDDRPPVGPVTVAEGGQERMFDDVLELLARAAAEHGLLMVLDDVQLMPPTSLRLARQVAASGLPLAFVVTARETDPEAARELLGAVSDVEVLELKGLDVVDVDAYLAQAKLPDNSASASWLARQTGGNPYLLREATRAVAALHAPLVLEDGLPAELQEAARRLLAVRLEGLGARSLRVLEGAAVLGDRFAAADLARLVPGAGRHLGEARRAGLLAPGPDGRSLVFAHQLIREAIYQSLAPGERLELHEAAADAVRLGDDPLAGRLDQIARHHLATAELDPDRAIRSARAAGDAHVAAFAFAEGAHRYLQALEVARRSSAAPSVSLGLAVDRGSALRQAGDSACVEVLMNAAEEAERLGEADLFAQAALGLCRLGPTTMSGAVDERAASVALRALSSAASPALLAEVAAAASLAHSMDGDPARCRQLYLRGESLARASGARGVLARVLPHAYLALGSPRDLERREAIALELAQLAEVAGDPAAAWEAHQLSFSARLQRGDRRLFDELSTLRAIAERLREPTRAWQTAYLEAAAAHVGGRPGEAEAIIDQSLEFARSVAPTRVRATWWAQITAIRLDEGRVGELVEDLERLADEQPGLPAWRAFAVLGRVERGDRRAGAAGLERFWRSGSFQIPDDFSYSSVATALARAAVGLSHEGAARDLTAALAPLSGRMSWCGTCTYGPVDTALGLLHRLAGRNELARKHLREASRLATALGARSQSAEANRLLAET